MQGTKMETAHSGQQKALLLQGPVGPFFSNLRRQFHAQGFSVKRVVFNAADALFYRKGDVARFYGSPEEWETWITAELHDNRPDVIVLFGSMRPAHIIARRKAEEFGIDVICLEEGYLRAGYIACEVGGNNQHSPMCSWHPKQRLVGELPQPMIMGSSFAIMSIWGAIYYLFRDAFSRRDDEPLFHRNKENLIALSYSWFLHLLRRFFARFREARELDFLTGEGRPKFIIVPLQVPSDSQVKTASRGWNSDKLVEACLKGLAQGPGELELVFKLHPLDRSGETMRKRIRKRARQMGLAERVRVFHSGALGRMAEAASGMVVINSTSVFSALHHELPVMVLGDAIFRHESIVTLGQSPLDVVDFFEKRSSKNSKDISRFLQVLRSSALLPGDFYRGRGRHVAAAEIARFAESIVLARTHAEAAE